LQLGVSLCHHSNIMQSKKRPRDANQFTRFFVDLVTGNPINEDISPIADKAKNPASMEPGKFGGLKDKFKASKSHSNKT
jgi:hypothetical protein